MTKLLLRLFVKDYENTEYAYVRSDVGRLAGVTGIVCNLLLFAFKLAAGILSGALSIIADAVNNLSDASSSIVTILGFHMAKRPADEEHPYGHARYEYLAGLIIAFLIMAVGLGLGKSSFSKILDPTKTQITPLTFLILLVSVFVKLWMNVFYNNLGKHIGSTTLRAAATDSRNDVITTAAVLLGCLVEFHTGILIDGYIGVLVAAFIIWSGISTVRDTLSPLLGKKADKILTENIERQILSYDMVLGIHDLLVHDYGPGQCFASVHAELDASEDPLMCHEVIDEIERSALRDLNVHLVIHHDPVVLNDTEWSEKRALVEKIVSDIDENLSIHDFRLTGDGKRKKMVFDLEVPYKMKKSPAELKSEIDDKLCDMGEEYKTVIYFDGKA